VCCVCAQCLLARVLEPVRGPVLLCCIFTGRTGRDLPAWVGHEVLGGSVGAWILMHLSISEFCSAIMVMRLSAH
jgi:hypothetical protein